MKQIKRMLALLTCAAMVLSVTACGTKPPSSTGKTTSNPVESTPKAEEITLAVAWWGGATRNERVEKSLDMYSELKPNIKFSTATNNFTDHYTAMSTAAASGDLPDMWLMSTQMWMNEFVSGNQLLNLTPYIESGALDVSKIPASIMESGRASDGNIYAVGAGYNTPGMQYNKTLLDEHNIEIKNGMTLDEFAEKCAEIYEKTGVKSVINNPEAFIEYLLRADGNLLYGDGKIGVESPEDLLSYFELMERGRSEGWLIDYETYVTSGGDAATQPIVTGDAWNAMWMSNQVAALQDPCPEGVVLGMVTWPTPDLTASNYMKAAMGWGIGSNTKNPDEAVALLNYWLNTLDVHEVILGELGVPLNAEVAEGIKPLLDETTSRSFDYVLNEVVPHSSAENPAGGVGAAEVRSLIDELEEATYYGSITAAQAAERLFTEGNAAMAVS